MEYEIKHTQQELNLIYQALGELPLKVSFNLLCKLRAAQEEQDKEKALPISDLGVE